MLGLPSPSLSDAWRFRVWEPRQGAPGEPGGALAELPGGAVTEAMRRLPGPPGLGGPPLGSAEKRPVLEEVAAELVPGPERGMGR